MNFLQWLTIGFTAFLFILVASYWFGWSKPEAGKDYRWQMFSALLSIEGLLLGVFLQEGRVQEQTRQVAEARQVAANYSEQVDRLEGLTNRLSQQVTTSQGRASLDSIHMVIDNTRNFQSTLGRPAPIHRRP